jgi:hypothetical protein
MIPIIWPINLRTPHFELGTSFAAGLTRLSELGQVHETTNEEDGHMARVDAPGFSVALYEGNGRIKAVWYDDPSGRVLTFGRRRKIALYLKRFTDKGTWKQTLDNGYMLWWFNEIDDRVLVYGLHADVFRVNDRKKYDASAS